MASERKDGWIGTPCSHSKSVKSTATQEAINQRSSTTERRHSALISSGKRSISNLPFDVIAKTVPTRAFTAVARTRETLVPGTTTASIGNEASDDAMDALSQAFPSLILKPTLDLAESQDPDYMKLIARHLGEDPGPQLPAWSDPESYMKGRLAWGTTEYNLRSRTWTQKAKALADNARKQAGIACKLLAHPLLSSYGHLITSDYQVPRPTFLLDKGNTRIITQPASVQVDRKDPPLVAQDNFAILARWTHLQHLLNTERPSESGGHLMQQLIETNTLKAYFQARKEILSLGHTLRFWLSIRMEYLEYLIYFMDDERKIVRNATTDAILSSSRDYREAVYMTSTLVHNVETLKPLLEEWVAEPTIDPDLHPVANMFWPEMKDLANELLVEMENMKLLVGKCMTPLYQRKRDTGLIVEIFYPQSQSVCMITAGGTTLRIKVR
jgi:hypothetical protein